MPDQGLTLVHIAFAGRPFLPAPAGRQAHLPAVGDVVYLNRSMVTDLGIDVQRAIGQPFRIVERAFSFPLLGPDAGAMVCCLLLEDPPTDGEEGDNPDA